VRAQIAEIRRQLRRCGELAEIATTADEVRRIARSGRAAVLMGIEGGHALEADTAVLRSFAQAGVRYVTLTHVGTHSWADASQSHAIHGGLSREGRELVRAMNRLGVLVDLSHVSDETFYDALEIAEAPVIVSHSSARAVTPGVRNVSDAMLRAVAENGGVVMINFYQRMVNTLITTEVMDEAERRLRERGQSLRQLWAVVAEVQRERGHRSALLSDVLDHIDHAIRVAGPDHVGIGSDFDGALMPRDLRDVTRLPWLTYGMLRRGHDEATVTKVLGGNALRVLEEAERVAEEIATRPAPAR
jgi:membrane dipeptidase